jgi:hypothetical protein
MKTDYGRILRSFKRSFIFSFSSAESESLFLSNKILIASPARFLSWMWMFFNRSKSLIFLSCSQLVRKREATQTIAERYITRSIIPICSLIIFRMGPTVTLPNERIVAQFAALFNILLFFVCEITKVGVSTSGYNAGRGLSHHHSSQSNG